MLARAMKEMFRVLNLCERRTKGKAGSEGIGNERVFPHAHTCSCKERHKWRLSTSVALLATSNITAARRDGAQHAKAQVEDLHICRSAGNK